MDSVHVIYEMEKLAFSLRSRRNQYTLNNINDIWCTQ